MTISEIGQNMLMPAMYGMRPPSTGDMTSRIMDDLDTNKDGVLSADEISKGGEFAQKILEADTDGDGLVTKDELISQISANGMQPPSASDIASRIIDDLDTNGDGVLSADEISAGGERAQKILDADANGDGLVTKDELISQISANGMQPPSASNIARRIIDDLDTNGDGVLSADEISAGVERAQRIYNANADGDGLVTNDELISQISGKMNLSDDDAKILLEMMRNSGINVTA